MTNQECAHVRGHEHVEDVVEALDCAGEEGADGGADGSGAVDDGGHGGQRLGGSAETGMGALKTGGSDIWSQSHSVRVTSFQVVQLH